MMKTTATISCPRCRINNYTPYGGEYNPDAPFPALSRTDNATYICSSCGQAEALEQYMGTLTSQRDWLVDE